MSTTACGGGGAEGGDGRKKREIQEDNPDNTDAGDHMASDETVNTYLTAGSKKRHQLAGRLRAHAKKRIEDAIREDGDLNEELQRIFSLSGFKEKEDCNPEKLPITEPKQVEEFRDQTEAQLF